MPIKRWTIICMRAVVDRFNGAMSLFDIVEVASMSGPASQVEEIRKTASEGMAILTPKITVVSLWTRSQAEVPEFGKTKMLVFSPDGKELAETAELKVNLQDGPRARTVTNLPGVLYSVDGTYIFRVMYKGKSGKWRKVDDVPLEVTLRGDDAELTAGAEREEE
jgi:hypothetical protein